MIRPASLFSLFSDVSTLKGVGEKQRALLVGLLGGPNILDLLLHCPNSLQIRRVVPALQQQEGLITLQVTVLEHRPPAQKGKPYYVAVQDAFGAPFTLSFFYANNQWLKKQLPINETVIVSGRLEFYDYALNQRLSMPHPDYIVPVDKASDIPELEPIYPLTQGISNKVLSKYIKQALPLAAQQPEWVDRSILVKQDWPSWQAAVRELHQPTSEALWENARQRLAFDELLSHQLALNLVRQQTIKLPSTPLINAGTLVTKAKDVLPFALTHAQNSSIAEVKTDLQQPQQTLRLLQGDVGSGKTVVAFLAACQAIESGFQAAIMAPTEILARQHMETMQGWANKAGIQIAALTGSDKGKKRTEILAEISSGKAQLVVGTHALFQEKVSFHKLGFVVIDEQHRFGVHQRLMLSEKGLNPHLLVMTATPIPRTLLLANYGDMATSKLDEKPAGRLPIKTSVLPNQKLMDIITALSRLLKQGAQAYWVCPLVEESEFLEVTAAEDRAEMLQQYFGDKVGLVHGRLTAEEKAIALEKFTQQQTQILVATTVIEVGVNVPNATVMVIDHAERFGLAQLHQLRGRVGRGNKESYCLLLYEPPLSKTGKARLKAMRDSEDGFYLAEQDLKLRGSGDVLGSRQSGFPALKIADWVEDRELLYMANDAAKMMLLPKQHVGLKEESLSLSKEKPQDTMATLLHLFQREQAADYLRAG